MALSVADQGAYELLGDFDVQLPDIHRDDPFRQVVKKLSIYFDETIELPSTFEQLRTTAAGRCLRLLVDHLANKPSQNPGIVNALLALKWHYSSDDDQQSVGLSRSYACEIVAWRFLSRLSERDALSYCLYELPAAQDPNLAQTRTTSNQQSHESSPLLPQRTNTLDPKLPWRRFGGSGTRTQLLGSLSFLKRSSNETSVDSNDPAIAFQGLNALEIAAVANAKRFMSQHIVQKTVTAIWTGHIVYWDSLSTSSRKQPRFYNPKTADPFSRLRVPKYMKYYEVAFFAVFLCLYYAVLIRGFTDKMTGTEIALLLWFASFFYGEINEWSDAGSIFYAADFWNVFDIAMIVIGIVFATLRVLGLSLGDENLSSWAFAILSLEALFMTPRICSILSLSPYWGTLIPCLKEMSKDFVKFMVLVLIFYIGFLTTFFLLGRKAFDLSEMAMNMTKIFYGSSYIGFDIMNDIDPIFGPPLMIIFVTLTNFLLLGSLTGILSNSFLRVTNRAREEYLYVYSVYVLEASTSNRLVHFYPPFNLLALLLFRPWALLVPKSRAVRKGRIVLLKITHLPLVGVIKFYEIFSRQTFGSEGSMFNLAAEHRSQSTIRPSSTHQHQEPSAPGSGGNMRKLSLHEDAVDEDSAVEAQLSELHRKIDHLTQVVLSLQENQVNESKATFQKSWISP